MAQGDETESPKRRAILNAATELFAARGYGAVSMDAIARAADVSKATLYAHFESKDRLFATIVQDRLPGKHHSGGRFVRWADRHGRRIAGDRHTHSAVFSCARDRWRSIGW